MNASGALAAHFARTACWLSPSGRSRYRGGLFGFGDHAAADASCARRLNGSFAESAGVLTAAGASSLAAALAFGVPRPPPLPRGDRQHGLMMYRLPNTSACFIPIRVAPYPPIECPTSPRLSRLAIVR